MYELALIDFSMPEMDGPQTAKALLTYFQENEAERHKIARPYLGCVTAYTQVSFMKEAISAGFNKFMSKPISSDELDDCLSNIQ